MCQRVRIDSLSSEGEGIGKLEEGRKVFVEGALPGEVIDCEVTDLKKNFAKGRLLKIVSASPARTPPPCPLFGTCGGCQLMHAAYEEQLRLKQERVVEALRRIAHLEVEVAPCRASPAPLHYRNKIQLPVDQGKVGLYKRHSHEVIPIENCLIQSPLGERILQTLKSRLPANTRTVLIRTSHYRQEALVIVVTRGGTPHSWGEEIMAQIPEVIGVVENVQLSESNVVLGPTWNTLAGRPFLYEQLLGLTFKVSPGAFFQVNTLQAEALFSDALDFANITSESVVWDAFCGVGTLALLAAKRAKKVYGTEVIASAIDDAKENARLNQLTNTSFRVGRAEEQHLTPDILFLNPPRKGCEGNLIQKIILQKIPRLIYISCDPATLARDLHLLAPHYQIEGVRPFDMFPQTSHVETLVSLKSR